MAKIIKINSKKDVTLDGLMTIGKLENDALCAEFTCCEDVVLESITAQCKVQVMRDGNVYITEMPKRVRNTPIFRDDNSSLSKGRNGRYYFVFSMEEERLEELPRELVRQASAIAGKVENLKFKIEPKVGGSARRKAKIEPN